MICSNLVPNIVTKVGDIRVFAAFASIASLSSLGWTIKPPASNEESKEEELFRLTVESDAVTSRGSKHLKMLINSMKKGYKPYVLFLTQNQNINEFKIAKDIDANYYKD